MSKEFKIYIFPNYRCPLSIVSIFKIFNLASRNIFTHNEIGKNAIWKKKTKNKIGRKIL